jgi:hypothetical protein
MAMQRCLALRTLRTVDHDDIQEDDAVEEVDDDLFTAPFLRLLTFHLSTSSEGPNAHDRWLLSRNGASVQSKTSPSTHHTISSAS